MTAAEMKRLLTKWQSGGGYLLTEDRQLKVPVTIADVRVVWGQVQLQVSPVGGTGSIWVSENRVLQF